MKMITTLVVRAIDFCARLAWPVIGVALLLTVVSSWYAATHFAMTTDINQLPPTKFIGFNLGVTF